MELTQNNLQAQVKEILHKCRFSKINIIRVLRKASPIRGPFDHLFKIKSLMLNKKA